MKILGLLAPGQVPHVLQGTKASGPILVNYLSWTTINWLGVDLRTDTKKASCVLRILDYVVKIC